MQKEILLPLFFFLLIGCASKPPEIAFSRSLMFQNESYIADGNPPQRFDCPYPDEEPRQVGVILHNGLQLPLECTKSITRPDPRSLSRETSVTLIEPITTQKPETLNLSHRSNNKLGDGQEYRSETRSWMTRDKKNQLHLVTVWLISEPYYLYSEDNIECSDENNNCHSCLKEISSFIWNEKEKMFYALDPPGASKFDMSRFTPPLNVHQECLNTKGEWAPEASP